MGRFAVLLLVLALSAPAADPTLVKLAMPDARVVVGINVTQTRDSPFGQFLLSEIAGEGQDFQKFVSATGFDPRYDLDEILFVSPGGAAEDQKLVLARGRFNASRIIELARSAGAQISTYQGIDVLSTGGRGHGGSHPGYLAFLDNTIAIAGDEQSVRAAIDRRQSGPGFSSTLTGKVNTLSGAQDAWFVSLVPISELASRVPDSNVGGALKGDALKSIDEASGGVKFGEAVKVSAAIVTRTAQDASSLADVLRFLAGLAQLQPRKPDQAGLHDLLNTLDLKTEGNAVKLALAIPEPQLESIIRQGKK